jgi:predicted DCC family thiol-disulfide oxidoreductase YuxK
VTETVTRAERTTTFQSAMADGPVLLYDGLCGFCNGTVQFVLRHDRRGTMRFATLQGEFARQVIARHPDLASVDSLILLEKSTTTDAEAVSARSSAVLGVARYLGGPWNVVRVFVIIPLFLRDWAYDVFARFRYRLFGRYDRCPVPSAAERARFID